MQERKGRVGPEIIARLPVRFFVFHWQCFFSGLTEAQSSWSPIYHHMWSFRSICSSSTPLSRFLFGDELSKSVKDITRANMQDHGQKLCPRNGKQVLTIGKTNVLFCGTARPHHAAVITTTASTRETSPEGSRVTTRRTWRTKRKCKLRRLFI